MDEAREGEQAEHSENSSSGGLLSGQRLFEALSQPDHIFRDGSWEPRQVKGAGYELRLAGDLLVIPSEPGSDTFQTVHQGDQPIGDFTLNPGDSALVSTVERFCLDWDISVLIGPKFRWAARGLLVLHGMVAHPGYGRTQSPSGEWLPKDDERLYVVLANVGPKPIPMRRGDPIAYVQFFNVDAPAERKPIDNYGFDFLRETIFGATPNAASPGLAYFRNIRDLKQSVSHLETNIEDRFRLLNSRVEAAELSVDRVRNATDNVVVFGVFLVSATILGVVLTALVGLIRDLPSNLGDGRIALITALAVIYAAAVVVGVFLVWGSALKLRRDKRTR